MTAPTAPHFRSPTACSGRTDLMHPTDQEGVEVAREICLGCPVYLECDTWAAGLTVRQDPGGVIAAMTEAEREEMRATRTCTVCEVEKLIGDFALTRVVAGERHTTCKHCRRVEGGRRAYAAHLAARALEVAA